MSKKNLPNLSFEERRKLAAQVKGLRVDAGLKQADLAELAGITRQTLSNIERGAVPQIDNLRRIYEVLGVEITPSEFSEETSQWLAIVGGIMDTLPGEHKARAGQAAVEAVTAELVSAANVRGISENEIPHIGHVDIEQLRKSGVALAADERDGIEEEQEQSQEQP